MRTIATIFLVCLITFTVKKSCAESGGVRVFVWGGWVCIKPPGKIPLQGTKP
jgi:hypothetical protein